MNTKIIIKIISISLILFYILSMINLNQANNLDVGTSPNSETQASVKLTNIEEGVNVYLYKIAKIEYTSNQPKEGYIWEDAINNWVNENYSEFSNSENFYKQAQEDSKIAQTFYDELTAAIKSKSIEISPYASQKTEGIATYPVLEENLVGNTTFSNLDAGTYLVIIENGYVVYTPSVVNIVPIFDEETNTWKLQDQDVIIKATTPAITKTVTDEKMQKDNYSLNDEINYTIKADIPTYLENSLSKKYCISDKIDDSLTIDETSLKILGLKGSNEPEAITGYEITFDTTRPKTQEKVTFLIDFDYNKINQYEEIKIVYTAKLNSNSVIGTEGNNNYSYLDYSNNPYDETSIQSQDTNKITVYTYAIEVKSTDKDDLEKTLPGSEFILKDEEGNELYFIQKEEGKYYQASLEEDGATTKLTVDEEGNLYLYGLDEGTYTIEQTKAPEGYIVSSKTYEIELIDNQPDGELDKDYTIVFPNTKGFILPVTGGKGVIGFAITGIVLISMGIVLLIFMLKKKKIEKAKNM